MDSNKIMNFERDNPGRPFPSFRQVDRSEPEKFRESLKRKLSITEDTDGLALVHAVANVSVLVEGYSAEAEEFNLLAVVKDLGLLPMDSVYINWYRYDQIDRIAFKDLVSFFEYIWYPLIG